MFPSGEREIQSLTCLFQVNEGRISVFHVKILTDPDTGITENARNLEMGKLKVKLQSPSEYNFPHLHNGKNKNIYLAVFVRI